jgi:RND family efflux transporter MFP subunit
VLVATARRGAVPDRREYVGNVRAVAEIEVRARVRGYLVEQLFEDGRLVEAGQVLFRIDPEPFEVALAEARGRLASAEAEERRAEHDHTRAKELFDSKVISVSLLDERRAGRDAARAARESAEAAVRSAELDLSWCTVRAPIAGRIGRRLVDIGNLVGESGQDTVLARIVQVDPVHVYFAPTELDRLDVLQGAREGRIPQERVGAIPIELRLGDGTPYPHPGILDYVDPTIDPTRGTVEVRARVPNPEGDLKPGEFVRVTAVFPDVTDAVLVPQRAVQQEQAGTFVLVVGPDGMVENRAVELGVAHDALQQIRSGLAAGERVIVDGLQKARPGSPVAAREAGAG